MKKDLAVSVVGATGMVGLEFIKILEQRNFPVKELRLFASDKSAGTTLPFRGRDLKVHALTSGSFEHCDVAFFSAGAAVSKEWAPVAANSGAFAIDNSSAFRMDVDVPLVVPEVNGHLLTAFSSGKKKPQIIANPNCSTIQLVVALKPLSDAFRLKSVVVSTYQSVSGAGKDAVDELKAQTQLFLNGGSESTPRNFAHLIAFNNLPHIDLFDDTGFTLEEKKVINETRKIMNLPDLDVSVTAVRTPTLNSHSEAVWVELESDPTKREFIDALTRAAGVTVMDQPKENIYPNARLATNRDEVFVGRIRKDLTHPQRWLMWVVSDNIRKGAALNGLQIAEKLFVNSLEA